MKNVVLYASKYQHSFQYAQWISEALGWELISLDDIKRSDIVSYNHVIFGSGVYMGKMNQIKKVLRWFKDKSIIIYSTAGNLNDEAQIQVIKDRNFTQEQLAFHHFFYLPVALILPR
jgi:flavodoxin